MSNRNHKLPVTVQKDGPWYDKGHFEAPGVIVRVAGSSSAGGPGGWGFGGWGPDGVGREVFQGPLVQGPCAYLFGMAGVVDCHGGTGAEHARAADAGLLFDVEEGDILEAAGSRFRVRLCPRGYPKLDPV